MKNSVFNKKNVSFVAALSVLVFLPSCAPWEWVKQKFGGNSSQSVTAEADGSPVIVTMEGQPVITLNTFEREFNDFVDKNRLRPLIGFMPDAKDKFLDGLISQKVIDRDVETRGITETPEYKQEFDQIVKSARQMLNTKYFADLHPVEVSEAETKSFYEENKEKLPEVIVSRGGVAVVGIDFTDHAAATAFYDKVKNNPASFASAAKAAKLDGKIRDFELVDENSAALDPKLRDRIVMYERFPTIELIKTDDNACWVVYAKEKKRAECRPFDQVKSTVEQYVTREKRMQTFEKEIGSLRDKYQVMVDKTQFKGNEAAAPAMPEMAGEPEAVAPVAQAA